MENTDKIKYYDELERLALQCIKDMTDNDFNNIFNPRCIIGDVIKYKHDDYDINDNHDFRKYIDKRFSEMKSLDFKRYDSINNVLPEHARQYCRDKSLWYVMEKIHGANYQFVTNGVIVKPCSRNRILEVDDLTFFEHTKVFKRYEEKVIELYNYLVKQDYLKNGQILRLYGELAGIYSTGRVQDNADYGDLDFYLFDMYLNEKRWTIDNIYTRGELFDFKMVPLIGKYTFNEAIKLNNKFDTLIDSSCTCEGLILRNCGTNVTFKFKNDLFREVKSIDKLNKIIDKKIPKYVQYVTDNRVRAVISKEGEFNRKRFTEYVTLISMDIQKDMKEDKIEIDFDKDTVKIISSAIVDVFIKKEQ